MDNKEEGERNAMKRLQFPCALQSHSRFQHTTTTHHTTQHTTHIAALHTHTWYNRRRTNPTNPNPTLPTPTALYVHHCPLHKAIQSATGVWSCEEGPQQHPSNFPSRRGACQLCLTYGQQAALQWGECAVRGGGVIMGGVVSTHGGWWVATCGVHV